jgi:hypothetical protein
VEFQTFNSNSSEWKSKKKIFERTIPLHQAPNVYNCEIPSYVAMFTDFHQRNKIIGMFGIVFLALDWNNSSSNI